MAPIRTLAVRIPLAAAILAGLYLIPVNLALNLPATQTWLNRLQPQTLAVRWERAWSWYPLRVELKGLTADGQAAAAQWEVDAASAAASVALRPLLRGQILVHGVRLGDFRLHLRPLPQLGQDLKALKPFFPVIPGRDPEAQALAHPAPGGPLAFAIDDLRLSGGHEVWIGHIRASLEGEAQASVRLDADSAAGSAEGVADLDLRLRAFQVAGESGVSDAAQVRGRIDLAPLKPSALDLATALHALSVKADLDLPVHSLHFLNVLLKLDPPLLDGSGRVRGRLDLERGELRDDTDLTIAADRLQTGLGHFALAGNGTLHLQSDPRGEGDLSVRFETVEVSLTPEGTAGRAAAGPTELLYRGSGINVTLDLASDLGPHGRAADATRLILEVPEMTVPDISVYQRLLPARAGLTIRGGEGRLRGRAEVSRRTLAFDFTLASGAAQLIHDARQVTADLELRLRASGQTDPQAHPRTAHRAALDLTGTALTLNGVRVELPDQEQPLVWQAGLTVDEGHIAVPITAAEHTHGAMLALAERIGRQGFGSLLDHADGRLAPRLSVSRLNWLARLLGRPFGLGLIGSGEIALDLRLRDGWLAPDTSLSLRPKDLKVTLLEHLAEGEGEVTARVLQGGRHPLIELEARLRQARMHQQDSNRHELEQLDLDLSVRAQRPRTVAKHGTLRGGTTVLGLKLRSARVADMRVYNGYLPMPSPVQFAGGTAGLTGDLTLTPGSAKGEFHLKAEGVRVKLPQEEVSGDLRLQVLIRDGDAAERRFDIAGSALSFDRVQVAGSARDSGPPDWSARIEAERAELIWRKPIALKLKAGIAIKDSRPFVALLDNHRGRHPWIDQLLTIGDLGGHIELDLGPRGLRLPYAMLGSRELNVGAKGLYTPSGPEGVVYARFHDLAGLLTHRADQNQFDLVDARGRFEAYAPGPAPATATDPAGAKPAAARPAAHSPAHPTRQPAPPPRPPREAQAPGPFFEGDG